MIFNLPRIFDSGWWIPSWPLGLGEVVVVFGKLWNFFWSSNSSHHEITVGQLVTLNLDDTRIIILYLIYLPGSRVWGPVAFLGHLRMRSILAEGLDTAGVPRMVVLRMFINISSPVVSRFAPFRHGTLKWRPQKSFAFPIRSQYPWWFSREQGAGNRKLSIPTISSHNMIHVHM